MSQAGYEIREETFNSLENHLTDRRWNLNWPSVFILPFWLQTWWELFGEGYELGLFSFWKNETLIGISPLKYQGSSASLLGSPDICDYLDFIVAPGQERIFLNALLETLGHGKIRRLELFSQHPEALIFGSFFADRVSEGWTAIFEEENVTAEINLAANWDSYLAALHKKQRHEVRRKIRKLEHETEGYCYRQLAEKDEVIGFIPIFLELFLQNPDKKDFLTSEMENFFRCLIIRAAEKGLARFGLLNINDRVSAAVLCFDYEDRIYLYNSGYDSDYNALSAGLLAKIFCIKDSIESGKQVFDFLKGREVYKSRLGGKTVPIYKVTLERK